MAEDETIDTPRKESVVPSTPLRAASLITTLIKLGGLAIAANEALLVKPPRDAIVFAVAAFMMAGAQGLENFLGNVMQGADKKK
jgi:hypothetical protein